MTAFTENTPMPLRLLGRHTSINVRKALCTLDETGLPYTLEPWGSGALSLDDPRFVALNPNRLVPVLVDDASGFVLWESNSICRHLARRAGRDDLLPADPVGAARVEQWMDWQATELNRSWSYAFMALVRRSPAHGDAAQVAASAAQWNRQMALLDAALAAGGPWVTGAAFTLADIVLGLSTHRWLCTPIDRPVLPAVQAHYARLRERPSFREHARDGVP